MIYKKGWHFLDSNGHADEAKLKENFMMCLEMIIGHVPDDAEAFWLEIVKTYKGKDRFYHNLDHLAYMLHEAEPRSGSWLVVFSIFIHDYIMFFDGSSKNEELSADCGVAYLEKHNVPKEDIQIVKECVLVTKHVEHVSNDNKDAIFIADADIASLASNWEEFVANTELIRKEYMVYPLDEFIKRQKSFFQNLLTSQETIYQTEYYSRYEDQARQNIQRFLES